MKEIHIISKGKTFIALVDDEDYPVISRHHWNIMFIGKQNRPYAFTRFYTDDDKKNGKTFLMHHMIMGSSRQHDHINGNSLDNQKSNLRPATYQQNGWNKGKQSRRDKPSTSIYKGVFKSKDGWRVQIKTTMKGVKPAKFVRMGPFQEEIEAARAYNEKIVELRGEWAWVNPLPDTQLTQRY
jgi:hypothetical protein